MPINASLCLPQEMEAVYDHKDVMINNLRSRLLALESFRIKTKCSLCLETAVAPFAGTCGHIFCESCIEEAIIEEQVKDRDALEDAEEGKELLEDVYPFKQALACPSCPSCNNPAAFFRMIDQ